MTNSLKPKQVEAAVIVPVLEVEQAVAEIRMRYDPSAAVGVPAHITINYPFVPHIRYPQEAAKALRDVIAGFPRFSFRLTEIRSFPQAVYLSPQPAEPFIALIQAVFKQFPDSPPYEGEFLQPTPHLTLAQIPENELPKIKEEITGRIGSLLPIAAEARELWLMDNSEEIWKSRNVFQLKSK